MYFGVEQSLMGRRWVGPSDQIERAAAALMQHSDLPEPICKILAQRGVTSAEAEGYLNPKLRDLMPNPRHMKDCETAAARIVAAITSNQKIAIFADYDVDGACSATLLYDFINAFTPAPTIYIPDRIDEGYGPNAPAMAELADAHDLIICVDCGTLSHDALGAATGADVIVLDHHLGGETLPPAVAVVNPNRQDETGDLAHLCAAAVVFLVLVETARQMCSADLNPPNLMQALDLVALATVADVAPLIGVNRAFVRQGLAVMAQRGRIGLATLCDMAKIDTQPSAYHLGYVLGPRINAGGRIGQADLGAKLLTSSAEHDAEKHAALLEHYNTERRSIEADVTEAAKAQVDARGSDAPLTWAADDGWHAGVVGIVAARLKEATNRPSVVIGFDGDQGKGSGRSIAGVDLGAAIQSLARAGLIEKGGGHKMAAGLSLTRDQLEPAMEALNAQMQRQGAGQMGPRDLNIDGALYPSGASVELIEAMNAAGPFGTNAPAPRFIFPDCTVKFTKPVGNSHLKITFSDGFGGQIDAICFRAFETPLGPALQNAKGLRFHVAGRIEVNEWKGRKSPQLKLEDAAPA